MDVRRVQITGGSSFMITLPKDWANSVGLNKNDTVGIQVQPDGSLSIYPKGTAPTSKQSRKVIDATNIVDRGFLYRQLVGAYIAGHSSILITSEEPISSAITSTVNNFVQTSIGIETVEADESHILIADLIEYETIDPGRIIERMRLLIRGMMRDMYDAALTGDFENINDMKSRDTEIDRIFWLACRQCNIYQKDAVLSHKKGISIDFMTACITLCRVLEDMGDQVCIISDYLLMMTARAGGYEKNKEADKLGKTVVSLFTDSVKSWTEKDLLLAEKTINEINEVLGGFCRTSRKNIAADYGPGYAVGTLMIGSKKLLENCKIVAEYALALAME